MSVYAAIVATSLSAFAACSQDERQSFVGVHFVLDRGRPPADRENPLVLCNLVPNQGVRLTSILWMGGTYFSSRVDFHVTDDELNTAKLMPVRGSYSGLHPDGYLWSMVEDPDPPADLVRLSNQGSNTIVVRVEAGSGQRSIAQVNRNFASADVSSREVDADGLVGTLFFPSRDGPVRGAVLMLSSTAPSIVDDRMAFLLASRGRVVLKLRYVGADGLPAQLQSVPIEYFSRAVDFLRRMSTAASGDIVVLAFGRATEAAAVLGTQRDDIASLVLVSPSSVINSGERTGSPVDQPAWTLRGVPLPFVHGVDGEEDAIARQQAPYKTRPRFDLRLAALAANDPARIAYDEIKSPIILLACTGDEVWPSDRMASDIIDWVHRKGRDNVTARILPGCGHDLGAPIEPTTKRSFVGQDGVRYALGGEPEAVWYGQRAAWSEILRAIGANDDR